MGSPVRSQPPSGEQHEIRRGEHRAVVTEVGATLRHYSVGGDDVIDGSDGGERASDGRGQVLAPWPNRLDEGRYRFGDRDARAALDEPDLNNAIHGLVRWIPWTTRSRSDDAIDLGCALFAQPGYPWQIDLQVRYELDGSGLTVSSQITNVSDVPAPFGIGFHPYLTVGETVDRTRLLIPARRRLVSDERGLPIGDEPVAGTEFDFTHPATVGSRRLDAGFTDLVRGTDGLARSEVSALAGGRAVGVWVDAWFRYLMVYTGDTVQQTSRRRCSVAIEPMTCPPNALRTGTDVARIEPGDHVGGRWGLTPSTIPGGGST
jgi:aldose 1-epimerase